VPAVSACSSDTVRRSAARAAGRDHLEEIIVRTVKVVVGAVAVLALSACVVAPYRQAAYDSDGGDVVVTDLAPPAPHVEAVPVVPYPGAVWIGGYWSWSGRRHGWVPGRWERSRPGYAWTPHRWEHRGGRWHLHAGGWSRH
jgi:hypothetical protein